MMKSGIYIYNERAINKEKMVKKIYFEREINLSDKKTKNNFHLRRKKSVKNREEENKISVIYIRWKWAKRRGKIYF